MKKYSYIFLPALGMLLLIFDASTALLGAREGIELCAATVIPSLFPFFVLSILLTASLTGTSTPLLRPIGRICRMTPGTEGVLLIGLLGGYPTGAQSVSQLYGNGQLSRQHAQRLLGFCSNAGPAFIFGICGPMFPEKWMVWLLWGVQILSAIIVGSVLPGDPVKITETAQRSDMNLTQALDRALKTTVRVCGWVMLFRIVIKFADKWLLWRLPLECRMLVSGLMELTNGCCQLESIEHVGLRFLLASIVLSSGGLCVTMQTASVVRELGLGCYLRGKSLQTVVSAILSIILQALLFSQDYRLPAHFLVIFIPAAIFLVFRLRYEKKSSILKPVGV